MSVTPHSWGPISVQLEGSLVRLEPLASTHLPDLGRALSQPEIFRYLPTPPPKSPLDLERWLTGALQEVEAGASVVFAIVDKRSGQAVGSTRYMDIRRADRGLEIGSTWLLKDAQRTAINTECKYLLLCHAFDELDALRVQLKTDDRNEASKRAIARIGASFDGLLRCDRLCWDGHVRDSAYFSVVHHEWPQVKARLEKLLAARG